MKKINKKNCYYIGDRVADVKVARKSKVISVIIAGKCAWDSRKELVQAKPDFIVNEIDEVEEII